MFDRYSFSYLFGLLCFTVTSFAVFEVEAADSSRRMASQKTEMPGKPILGWAEKVKIFPGKLVLHAKLSPSTEVLSVNASNIKTFKKAGQRFVRFQLTDRYGTTETLERPVIRKAQIKRLAGDAQVRYVIELGICLGSLYQEEEVTLVDRGASEFDMILGREVLAGHILVDPSISFTVEPKCSPGKDSIAMVF